jgi:hypothetical protein
MNRKDLVVPIWVCGWMGFRDIVNAAVKSKVLMHTKIQAVVLEPKPVTLAAWFIILFLVHVTFTPSTVIFISVVCIVYLVNIWDLRFLQQLWMSRLWSSGTCRRSLKMEAVGSFWSIHTDLVDWMMSDHVITQAVRHKFLILDLQV